jgi:hypothetical protein
MPAQRAEARELPANTSYSLPFSPGFEESPVWPVETWQLASFQVTLSGKLTVPIELQLTPESEDLPVTLELVQHGRALWSQNLALKLVPELASGNRVFLFATTVFVDLTNPVRYEAGAQPYFTINGIVPVYKPGPGVEAEILANLATIVNVLESQGLTQQQVLATLEAQLAELGVSGATQEEMLRVLGEILEKP